MRRFRLIVLLALAGLLTWAAGHGAAEVPTGGRDSEAPAARPRRPVALALAGGRLLVANRAAGTVSVVDPQASAVPSEVRVGETLADLTPFPDGKSVVVADQAAGQLVRLGVEDGSLRITGRLAVGVS